MIPAALLKIAIPAAIAIGLAGWGYIERQGRHLAEQREAAQRLVIERQAEELAVMKRLHAASQATADELQRRLEADRLRDDEIRRTLDDALQQARAAGQPACETTTPVEHALRRRLRKP